MRSQTDRGQALRASLVEHARDLVAREGPDRLTMRALADEAGCALGLPYKVFADRQELVLELVRASFGDLHAKGEELIRRVGHGTVAGNIAWFAEWLLDSPGVALAQHVMQSPALGEAVVADFHATGHGPSLLEGVVSDYL